MVSALGNPTAQLFTKFLHVEQSRVICRRHVVGRHVGIALEFLIGDGDLQAITKLLCIFQGQLLHLVRRIATSEVTAKGVALNGVCEDDGGLSGVFHRSLVCSVDLTVVVAAALQCPNLVVGPVLNHGLGTRVTSEEVLTDVGAVVSLEGLVVAVKCFVHQVNKGIVLVGSEQLIPSAAPNHLDDVPAGALEEGFQFLNDLAITANRAVQALQVAVDDEGQVVQALLSRQLEHAARLGFVHFTVANESPGVLERGVLDATQVKVLVEPCLVDGLGRAKTQRDRRELPELGELARVRVGGKAVRGGNLLAETVHLFFGETSLDEGAGVGTGGGVALEEHVVAAAGVVLSAEEVVQADFIKSGDRGVGGDVSANLDAGALCARHLNGCIPTDPAAVLALHGLVAGEVRFLVNGNSVDVGSRVFLGELNALAPCLIQHVQQDVACARTALFLDETT